MYSKFEIQCVLAKERYTDFVWLGPVSQESVGENWVEVMHAGGPDREGMEVLLRKMPR